MKNLSPCDHESGNFHLTPVFYQKLGASKSNIIDSPKVRDEKLRKGWKKTGLARVSDGSDFSVSQTAERCQISSQKLRSVITKFEPPPARSISAA